jgi:Tfp pilus assembly protein PilO
MTRVQVLVAVLAAVLIVAVFYVLLFQPERNRLAEAEDEIAEEQAAQAELRREITELREVRDQAPEIDAEITAGEAVLPRAADVPGVLRQLQSAADESELVLESVTAAPPVELETGSPGLAAVQLGVELGGSYFQVIDFLRRVEDPTISVRGVTWESVSVAESDYPELAVVLTGTTYAVDPEVADPGQPLDDGPATAPPDEDEDDDVEVDVDVDVETNDDEDDDGGSP